jgi:hypothetical protein
MFTPKDLETMSCEQMAQAIVDAHKGLISRAEAWTDIEQFYPEKLRVEREASWQKQMHDLYSNETVDFLDDCFELIEENWDEASSYEDLY